MATFPIHLDSEKENAHFLQKEKTATMMAFNARSSNVLQPVSCAGAPLGGVNERAILGGGGGGAVRANYTNHVVQQQQTRIGGAVTKGAFREVGNVKGNDENAGYVTAAASKKNGSAAVPLEKFKTFSVYEDQCEEQNVAATVEHAAKTTASIAVFDKENCYIEQQEQQQQSRLQVLAKSDTFEKEYKIHDDEFILDTTPMSVTDVLSPMSVERSLITNSSSIIEIDESNIKKCSNENDQKILPRNDRERFYDVAVYQEDILDYFRESEKKHRPKPHYMRRQSDINHSMRTILVDWLVEVSEEYNLDTETLYLSVSYIDRFLSQMSVVRSKLQLVGTAAMFIASKYEEIYPPEVGEFVFITDDTYNKAQVLRMEQIILKILAFDLCTPTAYVFITAYAVQANVPEKVRLLTQYISELSLLEADPYLRFYPSLISAASLALARYTLNSPIWSDQLQTITKYRLEDLKEVVLCLSKTHNAAATNAQQAIQEKYRSDKFRKISTVEPAEMDETIFDDLVRRHYEMTNVAEKKDDAERLTVTTSNENVRRMISLMFN